MAACIELDFNEKNEPTPQALEVSSTENHQVNYAQKNTKSQAMVNYAIRYAKLGLKVFPLKEKGKSPVFKGSFQKATTDIIQIKKWWSKNPNYNIGIATGNGLLVLDLDINDEKGYNGISALKEWEGVNGSLPKSWTVNTGSGGKHIYFKVNKTLKNTVKTLLDGVDTRCDGGYIIAPPSIHPNGNRYKWLVSPKKDLAEANNLVYKLLEPPKEKKSSNSKPKKEGFKSPNSIMEGSRNDTLFRLACSLHEKGLSDEAIRQALIAENDNKSTDPLSEKEIESIFNSVTSRYKKGDSLKWLLVGEDGKKRISIPYLTEHVATTFNLINIYGSIREYDNGYYKATDVKELTYNLLPMEVKSNRVALEVERNLLLDKRLKVLEKDLAPRRYINFKNGVYDIKTKKLLKHREDKIFLSQIPYNFNRKAKKDALTEKYIKSITGDNKDFRSLLLQIIGVAISDIRSSKSWFYFYGGKDTGKSTFLNVIKKLLTSDEGINYYSTLPLKKLQNESDFDLYSILSVKANICSETNPEPIRNDTILKALTGGGNETLTFPRKFKESVQGTPKAMLLFAGNGEPPSIWTNNTDKSAFLNRLFPIEFTNVVAKEDKIPHLEDKIDYEYLIKIAIEELHNFLDANEEFTTPISIVKKRKEMCSESDSVSKFVEERIAIQEGYKVSVKATYSLFTSWCVDEGVIEEGQKNPISVIAFGKRLKTLTGCEKTTPTTPSNVKGGAQCKCWKGIKFTF